MCLDSIDNTNLPDIEDEIEAYKVFIQIPDGRLTTVYYTMDGEFLGLRKKRVIEADKWLRASDGTICIDKLAKSKCYPCGFHAYKNEEDAEASVDDAGGFTIKKVILRGVHTTGAETVWKDSQIAYVPVYVAKEMLVPGIQQCQKETGRVQENAS